MSVAAYQQSWDFNTGAAMGYTMTSQYHQPYGGDMMNGFHMKRQDQGQEQQQEAVVRKLSALSMYIQAHPLQNMAFDSQPDSLSPPKNSSPQSVLHGMPASMLDNSSTSDSSDLRYEQTHSIGSVSHCCQKLQSTGSASPPSPKNLLQQQFEAGRPFCSPKQQNWLSGDAVGDSDSSSLSFSDCREDSSGASGEGPGEMEEESGFKVPTSGLRRVGSSLSQKRGLSTHFVGKSKSFTSLADVANIQSIQELAKPDNPYIKRRKSVHNAALLERYRSFPLRSVDGAISKKNAGKTSSSLAVALAMSAAEGGNVMETLVEDANEGCAAQKGKMSGLGRGQPLCQSMDAASQMVSSGGLCGHVNGVRGAAMQSSWRNVWKSKGTLPQRSLSMVDLFESGRSPPTLAGAVSGFRE